MKSGKSPSGGNHRQLGKRDRAILADVIRYRLTTNELVHQRYLPQANINAVTKITSRLTMAGWIQRHTLVGSQLYFVPSRTACRHFALPVSRCRPLGLQSLATSLSIAQYCQTASQGYRLVDSSDLELNWPWIPPKLRTIPYAMLPGGDGGQLRPMRVDLGGTPEHVATKCAHDIKLRQQVGGFRALLGERRLVYVVLTSTKIKKDLIKSALQKRNWPDNMRFEVVVIPDLCWLLSL